jgi:hypothetical protein
MDEKLKKNIKKIAGDAEAKVTESILRWKFKKEGKELPDDKDLEEKSRLIMEQAHRTLSKSGKNIWDEIKRAYKKKGPKED